MLSPTPPPETKVALPTTMAARAAAVVECAALILMALVVGTMFAVWLLYDPTGLDAATYIVRQQHNIVVLHVLMPRVGTATVMMLVIAAAFARNDRNRFMLIVMSAAALVVAGLITRFLNQPINAMMITWSPDAPPADWTLWRDVWWRWHLLRLGAGLVALVLLTAAVRARRVADV